jgi:hypothetical protein
MTTIPRSCARHWPIALAEAFAERMHQRVRKEFWGYAPDEGASAEDPILKGTTASVRRRAIPPSPIIPRRRRCSGCWMPKMPPA